MACDLMLHASAQPVPVGILCGPSPVERGATGASLHADRLGEMPLTNRQIKVRPLPCPMKTPPMRVAIVAEHSSRAFWGRVIEASATVAREVRV
jgi:hypothetical protein